ncbi:MAG: Permease, related [Bacilli bacterium]|nr:Permease, related [Bacilli bacterium]
MNGRRFPVLASIVIAMLIASMDSTIMNTTMPIIAKELHEFNLYAWVFASYMIISTVTAPIYGRLSDIYGRKRVFGLSVILFMLGSLLSGMAQTMVQLIIYRALQGIGAGGIIPIAVVIAGDLFSVEQRGKIQALFTSMWGLSAVLGPLLGSFLVSNASWRWIFYINIPLGIITLALLTRYKDVYTAHKVSVDYIGAAIFTVAISLLLMDTVVSSHQLIFAIAGIVFLALFVFYERRQASPVIPLSLFKNRTVSWIIINTFLACTALFGTGSYLPLFLQKVTGDSLYVSGLVLVGSSAGWMLAAVPVGKWIMRFGYRLPIIAGNIVLVLGALMLALITAESGFWYLFAAMFVQGFAYGLLLTTAVIACQQLVEANQKGVSTSLQMFSRNLGTAIGVTIMGTFLIHAETVVVGIQHLFQFGLVISIAALVSSFLVARPVETTAGANSFAQ